MNYRDSQRPTDIICRGHNSAQNDAFDNRFIGMLVGRVTRIDDPDKQRRIKVHFQFQQDENVAEMESGWLWQITNFCGPTPHRKASAPAPSCWRRSKRPARRAA